MTQNQKFDVILNLEIVEHVENVDLYFKSCAKLLKKWINVYALNRTFLSFIKAIIGAEYIFEMAADWNS